MIIYGIEISNDQFKYCDQENHEYTDIKAGFSFATDILFWELRSHPYIYIYI